MTRASSSPPTTEKAFQSAVVDMARVFGWMVYHTFDSRRSAPGFPDLVMARNSRLIFAELKTEKGKLTPEQDAWLGELKWTEAEVYVWRPSDWDAIEETLRSVTGLPHVSRLRR